MASWKRIFFEETILKFLFYDKVIRIRVTGYELEFSGKNAIVNCLLGVGVASMTFVLVNLIHQPTTLRVAIEQFNLSIFIVVAVAKLYTTIFLYVPSNMASIYDKIAGVDGKLNTSSKTKLDLISISLPLFTFVSLICQIVLLLFIERKLVIWGICYYLPYLLLNHCLLEISIMKHQLNKRLQMIRSEEEPVDQVEQMMENTRELLEVNTQINSDCEVLVSGTIMANFMQFITFSFNLWIVQGTGQDFPNAFEHYPIIVTVRNCGYLGATFFLAYFSSMADNQVKHFITELDISLTGRPCSEELQNKITMYMLELAHTPVVINGLGLFDITCSSLITGSALVITYVMVIIQFS